MNDSRFDECTALIFGADLIDDGIEYYPDWSAAMNREFSIENERLRSLHSWAKALVSHDSSERLEVARTLLVSFRTWFDTLQNFARPLVGVLFLWLLGVKSARMDH